MALDYENLDILKFVRNKFKGPDHQEAYSIRSYFTLKCLAEFYTEKLASVENNSLKIIDYGSGPHMANVISAVPKACEIILAEYIEPFRAFVKKWVDGEPSGHDWSPLFKHVVETLEGEPDGAAAVREKELRSKLTIVPCDVTQDRIVADGHGGPYDVVMSFHCLDAAYNDLDSYKRGLAKTAALVKDGGYLVLSTTKREKVEADGEVPFYRVNGVKYYDIVPTSKAFIVEALTELGFIDICDKLVPIPPSENSNAQGFYFFTACKLKI